MKKGMKTKSFLVIAVVGCLFAQGSGATFVISNMDGPGEGFNHPGLGSDRLNALTYAANVWGSLILLTFE